MFPALDVAIKLLSTLPGIGQRSAMRLAFHFIKNDPFYAEQLARAILELKEKVRFCKICGGLSESEVCTICNHTDRNKKQLCVVEDPADIFAIETTGEFLGIYHVLMGALSPLDGIGPDDLRLSELEDRILKNQFEEIFIATNPTLEGDATAHYIESMIKNPEIRITRISHGITTGASLEYADKTTLARSIRNRQDLR